MIKSLILKSVALASLVLAFSAQADLKIQNAQYNENKGVVFIKGKIKGNASEKVFVLNAATGRYIGSIETASNKHQFRADMVMLSDAMVPCEIKVQTIMPRRGRGRSPSGDFDTMVVDNAPEHCGK